VSERKARQMGLTRAIRVLASALASDPWNRATRSMPDVNTADPASPRSRPMSMAGIDPQRRQPGRVARLLRHRRDLLHYENLQPVRAEGEGGRYDRRAATTTLGGKRAGQHVSGGLLSKGHPLGATGIANMYEVALHLRGEAGARQVEGAKVGLTHVVGLGTAAAVHLFEKA
jgi:acetyl-CoA acyltransferase